MSGPSRHRFVWLRNARARWWPGVTTFPCNANRIAGFLPVVLVLSIIILAYITAVPATLLPLYTANPFLGVFLLVVFHFIYFNVLANYILLLFADPGGVPDDWRAPLPEYMQEQSSNAQASSIPRSGSATELAHEGEALSSPPFPYFHLMCERTFSGHYRYCRYCNCYKPDRSHHCSACKRCILRMDHHCIFVNNCVSFLNQKFFLGFIAYGFLGCLFVSAVCFRTAASVMLDLPTSNVTSTSKHALAASFSPTLITAVIIGYISCSAFAVALAIFVAFHAFLTLRGRTTIEMYELTDRIRATRVKEYDLGPAKNIRAICGNVPFCWLLPTRAHIDGDGLTFERLVQNSEDPV